MNAYTPLPSHSCKAVCHSNKLRANEYSVQGVVVPVLKSTGNAVTWLAFSRVVRESPPSCTRVTPNYSACAQNNRVETRPLRNDIAGAIIQTMNTATKLLHAMRQNPNDWVMAKLLSVAKQHGLEVRSTGGSHHVFSHPSVKDPLSVPAHRPIKAIYIKRFVALIDQIQESP